MESASFCHACASPVAASEGASQVNGTGQQNNGNAGLALVCTLAVLFVIAAAFAVFQGSNSSGSRPFGTVVTMVKFQQLHTGMSYREAVEIIGAEGEEMSRSDLAGYTTVMYMWKNPGGSNMNAMFQNGGLVMKAQFGLE
jgi:hypothetical protein